jgi:hypothetical protein
MNAQEALNELHRLATRYQEVFLGTSSGNDVSRCVDLLQQLIDQADAKPKTLEELGWENTWFGETVDYSNGLTHIFFHINALFCPKAYSQFTYEDIIAIAEKMKELGWIE